VRDLLDTVDENWQEGRPTALGTVVATFRSAPRQPGAAMLVAEDGQVSGSVSGGCVEGAVYELAQQVIADGRPVLQRLRVSDDDAFAVGLTCGGILDVFVGTVDGKRFPELAAVVKSVRAEEPVAVTTVVEHPDESLVGRHLVVWPDRRAGDLAPPVSTMPSPTTRAACWPADGSGLLHYGPDGQRRGEGMAVFVNSFEPPPRMLVFGAIDFAAAMVRLGAYLGYRVTVCDARAGSRPRAVSPTPTRLWVDWPHRYLVRQAAEGKIDHRTVIAVLTHDPKFDVPVLEVALRLDVAYIGAMGSRRTHSDRLARLREAACPTRSWPGCPRDRPGPRRADPEETAVSIAAEIIALRWAAAATAWPTPTAPSTAPADPPAPSKR